MMVETRTKRPIDPEREEDNKEKSENFSVMVPPELWKRIKPVMERLYIGKTTFTCQAFDYYLSHLE